MRFTVTPFGVPNGVPPGDKFVMTHTAYLALGSNLGDRRENLQAALRLLARHDGIRVGKVSTFVETTPVGGPSGQPAYVNAAAELHTELQPRQLLEVLLDVERSLGRVRDGERNQPRTLDLDLLIYDDLVLTDDDLTVPHPRLHERWFVLAPLAEIAPDLLHPTLRRTMRDLLQDLRVDAATGGPVAAGRELAGRRAVVTGATSGIGKAIALELAGAGADVVIHGRRTAAAEKVARLVAERQVQARVLLADLHFAEACAALVESAFAVWGHIDIWINNAGADTLTGEASRWHFEKKLQELLAVDVTGTMLLARAVGERMKQHGRGVIVNMGWDQAETGMEGDSGQLFAAAKSAIMAFSKSLALTLAPEVRVNCVAPGWIRTAWGEAASQAWQDRAIREAPLGRWGTVEDVARAVRWLVSPAADFMTGQVIRVNGGAIR